MPTWTFKSLCALAGLLVASACQTTGGHSFAAPSLERVTTVRLAGGAVTLAAPQGYCVDTQSVRRSSTGSFALLARCDTLGMRGFFATQDLVLITVTTLDWPDGGQPSAETLARSARPARMLTAKTINDLPFLSMQDSRHKVDGASPTYWRSAFVVEDQLVGVALYANEGSPALTRKGARILADLTERTKQASSTSE